MLKKRDKKSKNRMSQVRDVTFWFWLASGAVLLCSIPLTIDTFGIYNYASKERPDFPWPKISEFWIAILACALLMTASRFFEMIFYYPCSLIVKEQ
jgi:hypothetical protein